VCYTVQGWRHLVKVTEVTSGLAEINGSPPTGGWPKVSCGLTARTPGSAAGPTLGNEYDCETLGLLGTVKLKTLGLVMGGSVRGAWRSA